ncbi:MAG: hypothetical protein NUW23_01400 [Firmicutes bacterium]|nr:hypothetical protein [Bacillota bacterium]
MRIEKLAIQGRDKYPLLELEFAPDFSLILARDPEIRRLVVGALESLGSQGGAMKDPGTAVRSAVTVVDESDRKLMFVRDFLSGGGLRVVDLDTGLEARPPERVAESLTLLDREFGKLDGKKVIGRIPLSELLGDDGVRLAGAVDIIDARIASVESHRKPGAADVRNRISEILSMRARRDELRERLTWLSERIVYLDSRISYIDQALRAHAERKEIEEYIARLKAEFDTTRKRLSDVTSAETSLATAKAALKAFCGRESAFDPSIASEIRALQNTLGPLERQAVEQEAQQSQWSGRFTRLKADLASVVQSLEEMDSARLSRETAGQIQSLAISVEERELRLASLEESIAALDRALLRQRLCEVLSLSGGILTVLCVLGFLSPGRSFWLFGRAIPGNPLLFAGLATGVAAAAIGLMGGARLEAKHEAKERLEKERTTLWRQLGWSRQQLAVVLGGHSLEQYMADLETHRRLVERRAELEKSVEAAGIDLTRARNEADLLRVRIQRCRERLSELLRIVGFSSSAKYLEECEHYRRVELAAEEAAARLRSVLGNRSRWTLETDLEIIVEEIASAEAERDALADPKTSERVMDLVEEYALKITERMALARESEMGAAELARIEQDLSGLDMWELASDAAELEKDESERGEDRAALSIARLILLEVMEDAGSFAGAKLASLTSDILDFMTGAAGHRVAHRIEGDELVLTIDEQDADTLVRAALAARLAASECANGHGVHPLLLVYPPLQAGVCKGRAGRRTQDVARQILPALRKLARTRQVIWLAEGVDLEEAFPEGQPVNII